MRRKFGNYRIDVSNKKTSKDEDKIILSVTLAGNIEIGIDIDTYTWREDWLLKLFFGDNYMDYRLLGVTNNYDYNASVDTNYVRAVAEKRY